jgi:hypothetical protein
MRVIKWKRMRWAEYVGRFEDRKGAYRVLVKRPEVRRPLERARHRW